MEAGWGGGQLQARWPLPVHGAVQLEQLLVKVFVIVLQKAEPIELN